MVVQMTVCPILNTQCGGDECAWWDATNSCCAIQTIAMGISVQATTQADNRIASNL